MDARDERDKQRESESDRRRPNPDLRFDDRNSKKLKLCGKKFKVSANTMRFYRILLFTWL